MLAAAAATVTTALTLPLATPAHAQATASRTYTGTASITVETYDYCGGQFGGELRRVGTQRYSVGAQFITRERRSAGGFVERNPFNWEFYAGKIGAVGSFQLGSATVVNTSGRDLAGNPRDPRLLLQYWATTLSGSSWSGRLVDEHQREGAVLNTFFVRKPIVPCRDLGSIPFPLSVRAGTTVSGTVTSRSASFTIQGGTSTGEHRFRIVFRS